MAIFKEALAVIHDFADAETLSVLRHSALSRLAGERVHIPGHKRGSTIAYAHVRNAYPELARFYQSDSLAGYISGIVGVRVAPTPLLDQSSCSVLVYDQAGDRIGWHYDHNFYNGRHFTALLSLVNEHLSEPRLSSAQLLVKREGLDLAVPTPPNTLVLFEGALVRHCVTPLRTREKRVVLSMTFCTDPTTTPFRDLQRRFKDVAYLGIRALWT